MKYNLKIWLSTLIVFNSCVFEWNRNWFNKLKRLPRDHNGLTPRWPQSPPDFIKYSLENIFPQTASSGDELSGRKQILEIIIAKYLGRNIFLLSVIPGQARIIFLLDRDSLSRHIYNSNCMPAFLGRSIRHDANAMQLCKYIRYGSVSAFPAFCRSYE